MQVEIMDNNITMHAEKHFLSYDVASGSVITLCTKICKPLVVYRFSGNVIKLRF